MDTTEQWRPVVGYAGLYEVSDAGRVRSLERSCPMKGGVRTVPARMLALSTITGGYVAVSLNLDGQGKTQPVHSMVLRAFVGPRPPGADSCHGNGIRTDNRLVNLRWGTRQENSDDKRLHGTVPHGEQSVRATLTDAEAIEARRLHGEGVHARDLAARFRMSYSGMEKMLAGVSFRHLPTVPGNRHGNAALTAEQVDQAREALSRGLRATDIARSLGVASSVISRIASGAAWSRRPPMADVAPLAVTRAKVGRAKLDDDQVRELRGLGAAGADRPSLAARYGITIGNLYKILRGALYAHVG